MGFLLENGDSLLIESGSKLLLEAATTGSATDVFEIDVLKATTGQATSILTTTPFAVVGVSAHTTTPTDSAAGTEVSGSNYSRIDSKGLWATPAAGVVVTNAALNFPVASGSWGTISGLGLWTSLTTGTRVAWGTPAVDKAIASGDQLSIASGQLSITIA